MNAARDLLAETGEKPSMRVVGERTGLARSSVYQYFASAEELLAAVVADVFPDWAGRVLDEVATASTPGDRVWAYIEANIDLFASSEQAVAVALTRVVDPQVLQGPMQEFHARLEAPLHHALRDLGEAEPDAMARHINSLVVQAARDLEGVGPETIGSLRNAALGRLRRLLRGYLSLPEA